MMLNQLILARGYVLAPMLPAKPETRASVANSGWRIGTALMRMLRGHFGKTPE